MGDSWPARLNLVSHRNHWPGVPFYWLPLPKAESETGGGIGWKPWRSRTGALAGTFIPEREPVSTDGQTFCNGIAGAAPVLEER